MMALRHALEQALSSDDPDVIVRTIREHVGSSHGLKNEAESVLVAHLLSEEKRQRINAAIGLYALTHIKLTEPTGRASIGSDTFEKLLAAAVVEADPVVRADQLWALGSQDFNGPLSHYASIVARLIEAIFFTTAPVSKETLDRLLYVYEKIRRQCPSIALLKEPKPKERSLLGYAVTGLPFILDDLNNPEVVLVFNYNLGAWLPPGGHFNPGIDEIPTERLVAKIREETGARCTVMWESRRFSKGSGEIAILPSPSFVLLEDLRGMRKSSSEIHAFHYDMNYICRIAGESIKDVGRGSQPVARVPLHGLIQELSPMTIRERVMQHLKGGATNFVPDDVVERIARSLDMIRDSLIPRYGYVERRIVGDLAVRFCQMLLSLTRSRTTKKELSGAVVGREDVLMFEEPRSEAVQNVERSRSRYESLLQQEPDLAKVNGR